MTLGPGVTVKHGADEYVIGRPLNSGGFGATFLAERTKPTPLKVVVKVPHSQWLADPIWAQKFAREARILANVKHPHVVRIVTYWEFAAGERAIVQELIDGAVDLYQRVRMEPDSTASAFLQALYAMGIRSVTQPA